MSGTFIFGTCVGVKSKDGTDKDGKPVKKWHVGIAVAKENGFEGETETVAVSVGAAYQEAGLLQVFTQLKGKPIGLPIRPGAFGRGNGDASMFFTLAGDGQPRPVPNLQPLTLKPAAAGAAQ